MAWTDPEARRAYKRAYYELNRDKILAAAKDYNARTFEARKAYRERNAEARRGHMVAYRERNVDQIRAYKQVYKADRKVEIREYNKSYWAANKDRYAESARERANAWARANPEKLRANQRHFRVSNPAKMAAYAAAREARKLKATPAWSNRKACDEVYELARLATELTGIKHSVDHLVPLRGKTVCGLHVQWNLQVITHVENSVKGHRTWPDMP